VTVPVYRKSIARSAFSKEDPKGVVPPRDLGATPKHTLAFACAGSAGNE
jgi:hypothetical protein